MICLIRDDDNGDNDDTLNLMQSKVNTKCLFSFFNCACVLETWLIGEYESFEIYS